MSYSDVCNLSVTENNHANNQLSTAELEALGFLKRSGMYGLAESFAYGKWDVPALDQFMCKVFSLPRSRWNLLRPEGLSLLCRSALMNLQKGLRVYEVAQAHYDLGNDLFEAMLDQSLTYTCGYWDGASDLNQAQEAKLELCCKKLQLKPGMKVLDIGCGWGNFAEYAARNYGVHVLGVTVSREQAKFAAERCRELPVEIALRDYREIEGQFDAIVSIEMIEAVGRKNLKVFFDTVSEKLKEDALFLLQVISAESFSLNSKPVFDEFLVWLIKYIFPNGYLPKLNELTRPALDNLVLEQMHGFGPDYDKTLLAWEKNFEAAWPTLKSHYDEVFRRRWRFYLLSCAALFRQKHVQLYQVLYSKRRV